ncbi:MAG: hypothetical protein AAFP78_10955, partial [Pseudomonadota bacterium]
MRGEDDIPLANQRDRAIVSQKRVHRREGMIDPSADETHPDEERRRREAQALFEISAVLFRDFDETIAELAAPGGRVAHGVHIADQRVRTASADRV